MKMDGSIHSVTTADSCFPSTHINITKNAPLSTFVLVMFQPCFCWVQQLKGQLFFMKQKLFSGAFYNSWHVSVVVSKLVIEHFTLLIVPHGAPLNFVCTGQFFTNFPLVYSRPSAPLLTAHSMGSAHPTPRSTSRTQSHMSRMLAGCLSVSLGPNSNFHPFRGKNVSWKTAGWGWGSCTMTTTTHAWLHKAVPTSSRSA